MCIKHVFHPTGPCCGTAGFCQRWPRIDWNKATWKVRQPAALWAEQRYAQFGYAGSPLVFFGAGDPDNGKYSYSGTFPTYNSEPASPTESIRDVLYSLHAYHMRAGEFVASYAGLCQWGTNSRERLCPTFYSLVLVDKGFIWAVSSVQFTVDNHQCTQIRAMASVLSDPITGPFEFPAHGGYYGPVNYHSWRDVLRSAECVFLPSIAARGLPTQADTQIEGGLLSRLELARQRLTTGLVAPSQFYRPTAMDLAVEWTLSGGIEFGVVHDARSALHGTCAISTGGVYASETIGDVTETWLASSPWQLVDRDDVVAEWGQVNRFERTDDNDTLPAWVEIELIRI